jgi:hypothetical protein
LYFEKCNRAIEAWRTNGPQPLNTIPRALDGTPLPVTVEEAEAEVVKEAPSNTDVSTADIVADNEVVDEEVVAAPSDTAEATSEGIITEKMSHDDERYGEEKKECGGDDDEVAPTSPPFAFTARATSNLEVSLDEGYGDNDDDGDDVAEDNDIEEEDEIVKEREEIEVVDSKFTEDDEEKVTAEDDNEDEDKDQVPEIPTLDTAGSTETEKDERTGMYRHTWNDLVRVADSKDSFVSNLTASKEEQENTETESTSTALEKEEEGAAAAVENAENFKEEEEDTNTNDPLKEEEKEMKTEDVTAVTPADSCHSGIWLFTDRENITHFFPPNFYPPYDTVEKRRIIFDVLKEEWDEKSLSFKPCGQGSMTKKKQVEDATRVFARQVDEMVSGVSGVLSTVIDSVCSPQNSPDKPPANVSK